MATYLENLERARVQGKKDAREGKHPTPRGGYVEIERAYEHAYFSTKLAQDVRAKYGTGNNSKEAKVD